MRRLIMLAPVLALALAVAACSGDAFNSPTGPGIDVSASATEARGGKSGGGGTVSGGGTLSLVMVVDQGTAGTSFSDTVTFNVSTGVTAYPWVTVKCYQDGRLVSQESNGVFPTSLDKNFQLGPSPSWAGGAATCTATLENWDSYSKHGTISAIASMSFDVAG